MILRLTATLKAREEGKACFFMQGKTFDDSIKPIPYSVLREYKHCLKVGYGIVIRIDKGEETPPNSELESKKIEVPESKVEVDEKEEKIEVPESKVEAEVKKKDTKNSETVVEKIEVANKKEKMKPTTKKIITKKTLAKKTRKTPLKKTIKKQIKSR